MKAENNRIRYIMLGAAAVLLVVAAVWLMVASSHTEEISRRQRLEAVTRSVEDAVTLCYSIEGAYPEDMEYLAENYGVTYDKSSYIIHYDCFASNIRPTITVIEKERV